MRTRPTCPYKEHDKAEQRPRMHRIAYRLGKTWITFGYVCPECRQIVRDIDFIDRKRQLQQ